jgi:transposase
LVEEPILTVLPHAKLGLTVMLIVVWLKIGMRLTEEAIPQILEQLCGIRISEGEVSHICTIIAEEFGEFYAQLENEVRQAQARYIDETSWRENGKTLWMWAFVTKGVALYKIAKSRGHEVPLEVLGENPNGIDVHDRFRAYDKLHGKTGNRPQQLCWFHILADSKDLAELHGVEGELIHNGLKTVFDEANKFEHTGTPVDVEKLIEKLGQVLERDFSKLKCRKFAKTIYKERDKLFLFVTNPEVDGTNNRAERAIRPNVVYRKISGGTRSAVGTKRYAVLGSVFQTFKLKGWNFVGKGLEIIRTSG